MNIVQTNDDTIHFKDNRGATNYLNDKIGQTQKSCSRSVYWYGKNDKVRGLRKKADRHGHHRCRQYLYESLICSQKNDGEPLLQISTTRVQKRKGGCSLSQLCTNSKS
jgi:hypothetical protein